MIKTFNVDNFKSLNNLSINLQPMTVIVGNNATGNSSFIDMYLMANCKVNVIANSTFSYWAARLNQDNILTIYPKKWYNSKYAVPDIFHNTL